jgi:two-component sensor histidine kinase
MLEQQAAQAMAVAVHELTTNPVKYGALSTPRGASACHAIRSSGIDT